MSLKILIVDDHPLMRGALRMAAEGLAAGTEVSLAGSLSEAVGHLRTFGPQDLLILDLALPDARGADGVQRMREAYPDTPIVVVSGDSDRVTILRCLDAGANGFVPKTASHERTQFALRQVLAGGVYVPAEAATRQDYGLAEPPPSLPQGADPRSLGLTDRQADVLKLMLLGLPNKLICRRLDLAEGTVKVHVSAVLRALGVRTRTQAVVAASRLGIRFREPPPPPPPLQARL